MIGPRTHKSHPISEENRLFSLIRTLLKGMMKNSYPTHFDPFLSTIAMRDGDTFGRIPWDRLTSTYVIVPATKGVISPQAQTSVPLFPNDNDPPSSIAKSLPLGLDSFAPGPATGGEIVLSVKHIGGQVRFLSWGMAP